MRNHLRLSVPALLSVLGMASAVQAGFVQTDLVSDISGTASIVDSNLKNPWGLTFTTGSPMWVADQGSNAATIYFALPQPMIGSPPSPVAIPTGGLGPPSGPTGVVFNSTSDFKIPAPKNTTVASTFIFDTLQGTIQGWSPGSTAGKASSLTMATVSGAVFTGLALANFGGNNFLYAANAAGSIVVFDKAFTNVTGTTFAGKFVDPNPVAGFTPFNIQNLNGNLFVTYAATTAMGAPLPGGYVDEFDPSGNFLERIATNGALNAPWGLTFAPAGFGPFGGDLLIGNLYNSTIDAYNLSSPAPTLDGSITVNTGYSSAVGLWGLDFGNGVTGNANTLYFTAGVNDQHDGLFGALAPAATPEPAFVLPVVLGAAGVGFRLWRRKRVGRQCLTAIM